MNVRALAVSPTVFDSANEAAGAVARRLVALVQARPDAVIGVATGSTVEPVYRALVELARQTQVVLGGVRWFALDEYVGLPPGHPQSYREVLLRQLIRPLGLAPTSLHVPDPDADPGSYDELIDAAGGIDRQLLGIGRNGHLAFNEPGTPFDSPTHRVALTDDTRAANARFFEGEESVPGFAVTQGLGTIFRAREWELLAFGASKAAAVRDALAGPVSAQCPASLVQRHPAVTVSMDAAAAALLSAEHAAVGRPA